MTLKDIQNRVQQAEKNLTDAKAEQSAAAKVLADAYSASQEPQRPPVDDADAADTLRTRALELDAAVLRAKGRVARAGFRIHHSETAAKEARDLLTRATPHAATLDRLAKAVAAVAEKDAALLALARTMQAQLATEVSKLQTSLVAAIEQFNLLPADVRRDVTVPTSVFGYANPTAPDLLARVGLVLGSTTIATRTDVPPTAPSKPA